MPLSQDQPSLSDAVAEALRRERAGRRITQEQAAEVLGVSRSWVADVESGRRRISADDLVMICCALRVSLQDLVAGTRAERLLAILRGEF